MPESYIFTTFIILIISVALWLLLREVFLWYWKVNKIVELLEKNNSLLESVLIGKNRKNPIDLPTEIENKPISEKKENGNIEPKKKEKPLSEEIQKLIKKLNFKIDHFSKFKDKIHYLVVDDLPVNVQSVKKNWHENHMRDQFKEMH